MANTAKTSSKGGFASTLRRIPKFFGFSKVYNFILFFIFGGPLPGFGLARFMYIDIPGILCGQNLAAPGKCYYYKTFDQYKVGIGLHLYTILSAALLVVPQFVPAIRYKAIIFHRINGYLVNVNLNGTAAQKMAAINMTFGMAGWVALAIHAFGVEVYLRLTPEESKRLQ